LEKWRYSSTHFLTSALARNIKSSIKIHYIHVYAIFEILFVSQKYKHGDGAKRFEAK